MQVHDAALYALGAVAHQYNTKTDMITQKEKTKRGEEE